MARTIGKTWKSLDKSEKDYYVGLADKEKEDYKAAMEAYQKQQDDLASAEALSE